MSVYEAERKAHVAKYGSFLWCPRREVHCDLMNAQWRTGKECHRDPCILDDPEDIALQKRIRKRRAENERKEAEAKAKEKQDPPAPIRRQNKTLEDRLWQEIRRLEEESRKAYERNMPKKGESLLYKAIALRRQLRRKERRSE